MGKLDRIVKKAIKIAENESEQASRKFLEEELKKEFDNISMEEFGRFMDKFEKEIAQFEKNANKFIEKQKKKKLKEK